MKNLEKLIKMEEKTGSTDCAKLVESVQECVVTNEKVGILNMINCDIGSDEVRHIVDMRNIISQVKLEMLSQLRSVAARAA